MVSVEEYLRSSYEPDADYVDGAVEERSAGEFDHSRLQTVIAAWFIGHYHPRINAYVELRTHIRDHCYRVPDILLLEGKQPRTGVLSTPPLAVIEILSPEDRPGRVWTRMQDYLSIGVRYCWLVDPATRSASRYSGAGIEDVADGILKGEAPDFEIPLPRIFAQLDAITE